MLSPNTTPETQYYGQPATRHRKMLTFLFTDVEGSTRLWEQHPQAMLAALAHHNDVLAAAIETHKGSVFKTLGDGFCAVVANAHDALAAAVEAQQALCSAGTQAIRLNVRMGLHSGPAEERDNDYFGPTLNRVARLMGAANGGQILISSATVAHLRGVLPPAVELRDMGKHRLRDINEPEHIFQVAAPNLPGVFAPINSLSPRPTNLPGQLTSFVGREREVHDLCSRLRQPEVRLLTLLGPGGIGKTRLSIQVGGSLRDEYTDGVFMVALSPVRQADSVIDAIAQVLKVEETGGTSLLEAVKATLRDRHLLLILDNFEQVVDAAPLVNDLLAAAPRLKIIVTSREELLIYGEQLYTLSPLTLPQAQHPADVMKSSAAALFIERVQAARPDFTLDETTAPHIAEICQRLDGLPLAIELASVRTRDLSLEEIARQLGNRLQTLSSGPRDLPARQRTMRGAIEWSYHLLSAEEQHAFAQLGIFSGQFTVEAADAIIGAQNLNRLKEKSLIRQVMADDQFVTFEKPN